MEAEPRTQLRARIRRRKPLWRRWGELIAGVLLMILGPLVGGPIVPGPAGFLAFALGLALVLRNSRWAKKRYIFFKRRWPRWAGWTDWGLRRGPRPAFTKAADEDRQQRQRGKAEERAEHGGIAEHSAKL